MTRELIATGVAGLDALLDGGVLPNALAFIIGAPGAGKTILGSQIAFNAARSGKRALILTAYSEGHEKLLQHLNGFDFFDETLIGTAVQLIAMRGLISERVSETANNVMRAIRDSGARVVLIDGFQGFTSTTERPDEARQLMALIAGQLAYIGANVYMTFAGDARDPLLNPALTIADVIVAINFGVSGLHHVRSIEVVKNRAGFQLPGLHGFRISSQGAIVSPRIEAYPEAITGPRPSGREMFGLPALDAILHGGLTAGTATILAGAAGTGKTTLALFWAIDGAQPNARSVFVTFREHLDQLAEKATTFGLSLEAKQSDGSLVVIRASPTKIDPDELASQLLELFHTSTVRRVIIDNVAFLTRALGSRATDFYAGLVEHLYGEGVTTLCTLDTTVADDFALDLSPTPLGVLADNVIVLVQHEHAGSLRRLMAVLRMSYSDYDRSLVELEFDAHGLRVQSMAEVPSQLDQRSNDRNVPPEAGTTP